MARSLGVLRSASMPFFPGASLASSEDDTGGVGNGTPGLGLGFRLPNLRHQDDHNPFSTSPSEYRSMRSSPSPSGLDDRDRDREYDPRGSMRLQLSSSPGAGSRGSPAFRQVDADRQHPPIESRGREPSTMGSLETLPEDSSQPFLLEGGAQGATTGSPFFSNMVQGVRERHSTPPVAVNNNHNNSNSSRSSSFNTNCAFTSSSPVSSLDSGSQFNSSNEQSLEAQLKALPLIHDILDRLVRCEHSTREIQHDLGDVHRKVNLLVERSLNSNANINNSQPEFKDPFASTGANVQTFNAPALNGPRASMGNIAPNQAVPSDDIGQISQRLNTLTSSVGQLLALQTQQHMHVANAGLANGQMMGGANQKLQEMGHNQILAHPMPPNNMLAHGLSNRPDLRQQSRAPNQPVRTWSAGILDLPKRPSETGSLGRSNDKPRRSVTGGPIPGLMRRESAGVRAKNYQIATVSDFRYARYLTCKVEIGLVVPLVTTAPWCQSGISYPLFLTLCGP